ncbi:unnamed protein product [Adineta steineri]|uniref:Uncharacterized protein n=1 Tax=Adineta steineri TaxID=433720 RepID=A0A814WWH7_9BILA|nr:unnamed protein product [Adineta steineri]
MQIQHYLNKLLCNNISFHMTNDNKPTRGRNDYICLGALSASLFFTIILRISLMIENRRRSKLSPDEYNNETSIKEPCDWHPDIRYAL